MTRQQKLDEQSKGEVMIEVRTKPGKGKRQTIDTVYEAVSTLPMDGYGRGQTIYATYPRAELAKAYADGFRAGRYGMGSPLAPPWESSAPAGKRKAFPR